MKPVVIPKKPRAIAEKMDRNFPYNVPGPKLRPSTDIDDLINHNEVGSNIETFFEKWNKVAKEKPKKTLQEWSKSVKKFHGNIQAS